MLSGLHLGQADSSVRCACRTTSRQFCPVCTSDDKLTVLSGLHVGRQADSSVRSACRTTSRQFYPVWISDKPTDLSSLDLGQADRSVHSGSRTNRQICPVWISDKPTDLSGLDLGQTDRSVRSGSRTSRQICPVWISDKPTDLSSLYLERYADSPRYNSPSLYLQAWTVPQFMPLPFPSQFLLLHSSCHSKPYNQRYKEHS